MLDAIEDLDDTQYVYSNFEMDEETVSRVERQGQGMGIRKPAILMAAFDCEGG